MATATKKVKPSFSVKAGPKSVVVRYVEDTLGLSAEEGVRQLRDAYRKVALSRGYWREKLLAEDPAVDEIKRELVAASEAWKAVSKKELRNLCSTCCKNPDKYGGNWGRDDGSGPAKKSIDVGDGQGGVKLVFVRPPAPTNGKSKGKGVADVTGSEVVETLDLSVIQLRILKLLNERGDEGVRRAEIARHVKLSVLTPDLGPNSGDESMVEQSDRENGRKSLAGMGLVRVALDPMPSSNRDVLLYSLTPKGQWVLSIVEPE